MSDPKSSPAPPWKKYTRLAIGVVALTATILAVRTFNIPECASIQAKIEEWGALAPVVYTLLYIVATVAFIPGLVITLVAGLAFGPWLGTALVALGANIGAVLAFLAARYVARDFIEGILGKQGWFTKFKHGVEENGFNFVMFVRLVPIFPFNGLNYACGLVPLKLRDYILGSVVGMLPGTFAYVYLGATGCKLIDSVIQGKFSPKDMPSDVRTSLFIAIGLLAALSVLPLFLKKIRAKKTA